ncbi:polyketide synthase [Crateriforma spongiae]|uniref:polyketide synthase n=1 Tax=Crateriforma spongiae TaxID=2724528 RepID=UPI0039AFF596
MSSARSLDPKLASLIDQLRSRIRRYVAWDALLAALVIVLAGFWIGLALDYLPVKLGGTEMPRSARMLLLIAIAALLLFVVSRLLIGRLTRPLPDDSLALLIERKHPSLGGRLVTAVQLTRPGRQGDSHDDRLLGRVHREAVTGADDVDLGSVFQWRPLLRKIGLLLPLALAALLLLVISPQTAWTAASRLMLFSDQPWPRRASLEMVGVELPRITAGEQDDAEPLFVEFDGTTVRLPRGSDPVLRIRAKADDDAIVPDVCTAYYQTDAGTRGQANLRRVGRQRDGYQAFLLDGPPLAGLSESMSISIRGLDDRLDGYRIEAVTPPAVMQLDVQIRYPDYLRGDLPQGEQVIDRDTPYQAGLRIREGSRVRVTAHASSPIGAIDHQVTQSGQVVPGIAPRIVDDAMSASLSIDHFDEATTVKLVPISDDGISAQAPYRYFFGVIRDQPPEVSLKLPGIGSAVTPIARLPIAVQATDDYGIDQSTVDLVVSSPEASGTPNEPLSVFRPTPDRDGRSEGAIDLRDLADQGTIETLQPGGSISVYAEATDAYDLDGRHVSQSEMFRLQIVTPEDLLALLERRELGLRARLEQTIDETQTLRDGLARLEMPGEPVSGTSEDSDEQASPDRQRQILRLRIQQAALQASKSSEELNGIVAALGDLLEEMVNNRVDSVDRRERIGQSVRDPLRSVVDNEMQRLSARIAELMLAAEAKDDAADAPNSNNETTQPESSDDAAADSIAGSVPSGRQAVQARQAAVLAADQALLQLSAILEKMLDLESYNEILDMVRGLIDDQEQLLEETKEQQKARIKSFFD